MAINIYDIATPANQPLMNTAMELPFAELAALGDKVQTRADQTRANNEALNGLYADWKVAKKDIPAYNALLESVNEDVNNFAAKYANSMSTPEAQQEFLRMAQKHKNNTAKAGFEQSYLGEQSYEKLKQEKDKWGRDYNFMRTEGSYNNWGGTYAQKEDGTFDYSKANTYSPEAYTSYADINDKIESYGNNLANSGYYNEKIGDMFKTGEGADGIEYKRAHDVISQGWNDFQGTVEYDNLYNQNYAILLNKNKGVEPTWEEVSKATKEDFDNRVIRAANEKANMTTKHTESMSGLYEAKNAKDIYEGNHITPYGTTTSTKTNLPVYDELVKQNNEKTSQYNKFIMERNKFPKGSAGWEFNNNKAKEMEAELSTQNSMLEAAQGEAYRNKLPAPLYNIWERFKDIGIKSPDNPNGFTWDNLNVEEKNAVLKYMEENKKTVITDDYDQFGNKRGIQPTQLVPDNWTAKGKSDQDLFHDVMEVVKHNVKDSDVKDAYTNMSKNENSFQTMAYGVQQTPVAAHQDPMGKTFFNMLVNGNLATTLLDDNGTSLGSATENSWKVIKASKNGTVVDMVKDPVYGGYRMTIKYDAYEDSDGNKVPAGTAIAIVKPGESNIPSIQGQYLMNNARDGQGNIINQKQYEDGLNMMNDHFYWQANNLNPDSKVKLSQLVTNPENKNDYQKVKDVGTLEEKVNPSTGVHTFILTPAPGMKYNSGQGEVPLNAPLIYGSKEAALKQVGLIFDYNFN